MSNQELINTIILQSKEILSLDNYKKEIQKLISNLNEKSLNHIKYTILHKDAILSLQKDFINIIPPMNLDNHDRDKIVYYLLLNDTKVASKLHRETMKHHGFPTTNELCYEIIFDYESAHMTKADKPLSAYDTVIVHHKELLDVLTPFLKELNLWEKSSEYVISYEDMIKNFDSIDDEGLINEIIKSLKYVSSENFFYDIVS